MLGTEITAPDQKLHRSLKELFRAVASRCHGKTLVLRHDTGYLVEAIKERQMEVISADFHPPDYRETNGESSPDSQHETAFPERSFNTVVVAGALEHVDEAAGRQGLLKAWQFLRPGGRLIVVVPNSYHARVIHQNCEFTRRSLRKMLRSLGRPKLVAEQPFKWLVMYVTKEGMDRTQLSHTVRARYRVTAGLCRGRVIELGCGEGHLTKMIADRQLEVVGVDINREKSPAPKASTLT